GGLHQLHCFFRIRIRIYSLYRLVSRRAHSRYYKRMTQPLSTQVCSLSLCCGSLCFNSSLHRQT
ncbi:unnamed protein product, partial [Amoebophrya sp. A25]